MAQISAGDEVVVFAFESSGLAQALEEAARVIRENPAGFDTKRAELRFGINGHEVVLPRKKVADRG